jgi:UDP-2,3-diacylglucosamine hydrolase
MPEETLFISDVHLDLKKPEVIQLFSEFLADRAKFASTVYILGDLFEVWVGDDEDEPVYSSITAELRELRNSGVSVFIMHGNRDFLLGQKFRRASGCQLIPDFTKITVYGKPTLLMHGDTLCSLDMDYQAFRQQVRNPQWQQQFLSYPLEKRRILAQQARQHSIHQTETYDSAMMDVTQESVESAFKTYKVYNLIHGHTHKPACHELMINSRLAHRYVLGDWHEKSAIILSCTANRWILCDFAKI